MASINDIKEQLFEVCEEHVKERIFHLQETMNNTQEAVKDESKSSVGDKYETTRAMLHLENEQNAIQLNEALKLKKILDLLPRASFSTVRPGALVSTSQGDFFFSISIGKIMLGKKKYFATSIASPIGQAFINKTKGDSILFNSINYKLKAIQ